MTPPLRTALAAALAGGALACAGLAAPAAAAPSRPWEAVLAAPFAGADAPHLVRSDPADGTSLPAAARHARLWFAGAGTRTPTVRVSTPRHPDMAAAAAAFADGVLDVRMPDEGPGTYRVVWYLLATGTAGDRGAAGTVTYTVGGTGSGGGSGGSSGGGSGRAFTIPPSATGAAAEVLAGTATTPQWATDEPSGTATSSRSSGTARGTTSPARTSRPAGSASRPRTAVPAAVAPDGPTGASALLPAGSALLPALPGPAGGALTALTGLVAFVLGARWSLRRGTLAAARAR